MVVCYKPKNDISWTLLQTFTPMWIYQEDSHISEGEKKGETLYFSTAVSGCGSSG